MLSLYLKALTKKADKPALRQFKAPPLSQRIYTDTFAFDEAHYSRYVDMTGWADAGEVHPLYLQMRSLPLQLRCLTDKKSPFPLMGLVHTSNSLTHHMALDRTGPVEMRAKIDRIAQHPRGWECELLISALQKGRLVMEARSRYLYRIRASHVEPRGKRTVSEGTEQHATEEATLSLALIHAPANTGRRYARLSGDANPIHLSAVSARLFGFRHPIAHGMWSLGKVMAELQKTGGLTTQARWRLDCQFRNAWSLPSDASLLKDAHIENHYLLRAVSDNKVILTCQIEKD